MELQACLIDVYETVLTYDIAAHSSKMPALAGVDAATWNEAFHELGPAITDGRLSILEAFAKVAERSGAAADPEHIGALVARADELLRETSRLYDDTVPFLESLRSKGVVTALVSNCADNTRPLLADLGMLDLVDAVVLSCEVGTAKPDAPIYQAALRALDVPPAAAVFVDDQVGYCEGAAALGIHAVRISRDGQEQPDDTLPMVRSLTELGHRFWPSV